MPTIVTDVPARLDRLPWSRWHWMVVIALGVTWVLDGLEVTLVGSIGRVLEEPETLGLTSTQVGLSATAYLSGAIIGSLFFGWLTDRLGRKRLFLVTLGVYLAATALTAASWSFASFVCFRFATGMGIGGEGAAMSSAIDELVPARVRGFVALTLSGSYWIGAAMGGAMTAVVLSPRLLGHALGWRFAFALGAVLGFCILLVRRLVPESPRWLLVHGRLDEAERVVKQIEDHVLGRDREAPTLPTIAITVRPRTPLREVVRTLAVRYRGRTLYGLALMIAQAFFYNAIFFTYSLILGAFYGVPAERIGWYVIPFAAGNFLGPLSLGRLFDSVGRRPMIAATYATSALLLALTGWLFQRGALDATSQTILWSVIFFIASAAASSAYLTVSEVFPVEIRALAIAMFYAVGTGVGGLLAPTIFGALIQTRDRTSVFHGYLFGAALMLAAAAVAARWGVRAERRSLEEIAAPLSSAREEPRRVDHDDARPPIE